MLILIICWLALIGLCQSQNCSELLNCDSCTKHANCGWFAPASSGKSLNDDTFRCVAGSQFECNLPECKKPHLYYHDYCPINLDFPIYHRRSIRKYLPVQVAPSTIKQLVDRAIWAPNCLDCEPLRWYVVQEADKLANISKATGMGTDIFHGAPTGVFLFTDACLPCLLMNDVDGGLALMNFELAAFNFGLATCTIGETTLAVDTIRKVVGAKETEEYVMGFALGHPNEAATGKRSPAVIKFV